MATNVLSLLLLAGDPLPAGVHPGGGQQAILPLLDDPSYTSQASPSRPDRQVIAQQSGAQATLPLRASEHGGAVRTKPADPAGVAKPLRRRQRQRSLWLPIFVVCVCWEPPFIP